VTAAPLLEVIDLTVDYPARRSSTVRAVDAVSFSIQPGETVGLVGESGSGKSTIGRAILGLTKPTSGSIRFDGVDLATLRPRQRRMLSSQLQVVFQDPYSSLNPSMRIGATLAEPLDSHGTTSSAERSRLVAAALQRVGLPEDAATRYPAQFSGGQRQRIAIARALITGPRLVICDEPVSALDLSIQAQILNLFGDLQSELELSYLFIAHDLGVVRHLSQRILVLRGGVVVESGEAASLYANPTHPYTRQLLTASPL
jgi:ABC-type oligopeptide transport system ATPase subunit